MVKTPDTDQFYWAPFQVFQIKLTPSAGSYLITKSYNTVGGEKHIYETVTRGPNKGKAYSRFHYLGHKQRDDVFGNIYRAFNNPYYTSRLGGSFTRGRYTPDTFTIAIGVTNLNDRHEEVSLDSEHGKPSIDYQLLFELLDGLHFRPLSVLHKNRKRIESEMEDAVNSLISSGRSLTKQSFVDKLSSIASKWADRVRDYISGGNKPNLKPKTKNYFRPLKQESHPGLYPRGMDEPLVETGQLLEAIDFSVFVDQSSEMKKYVEAEKKIEKRIREESKLSYKQSQQKNKKSEKRKEKYRAARESRISSDTSSIEDMILMIVAGADVPDIVYATVSKIIDESVTLSTPSTEDRKISSLQTVRRYRSTLRAIRKIDELGKKEGNVFGMPYDEWKKYTLNEVKTLYHNALAAKNYLLENGVEEVDI